MQILWKFIVNKDFLSGLENQPECHSAFTDGRTGTATHTHPRYCTNFTALGRHGARVLVVVCPQGPSPCPLLVASGVTGHVCIWPRRQTPGDIWAIQSLSEAGTPHPHSSRPSVSPSTPHCPQPLPARRKALENSRPSFFRGQTQAGGKARMPASRPLTQK